MNALELCGLSIGYRSRRRTTTVAAGLSAVARRGELTVLLGPNGCGKSTLIRTLCGWQPTLSGRVLLDGTDLAGVAADRLARQVAVVLTDRVDPGLLSARELTALGRIPYLGATGRPTPDDDRIIDRALTAVDAQHLATRPAVELSGGERQRVLIARALAQQPAVLVLDEPTAFLDAPSRTGLVEMLRGLARDQNLTIVMSTHDLELALRVGDRAWLLCRDATLVDAIPEELVLGGQIGTEFDSETLCFDATSGAFVVLDTAGRTARIDAPIPLRAALQQVLAREGWVPHESAEIVVTAADPDAITVREGAGSAASATLATLPSFLRALPAAGHRTCVSRAKSAVLLAELRDVNSYFAVETGPVHEGWLPVGQLYGDDALLDGIIGRVQAHMGAVEWRVAASTFFLGYAARLWSIGLGALAGYRLLPDLAPEHVLFQEDDGQIQLRIEHPVAWQGDDLELPLADMVLTANLAPLSAALRRIGHISDKLLRGNAASALLGAARAFDRNALPGHGWHLARQLCADQRLSEAIHFSGADYRRTSCCLYYRTPRGGLCGDCVFTTKPGRRRKVTS